jgi:hypothetical protein
MNDTFTQQQLYAFPPELCDELALASNEALAKYNNASVLVKTHMGPLEAAEALKMLEGTAKLLWKLLFRFFITVFGVTATTCFKLIFCTFFPAFG